MMTDQTPNDAGTSLLVALPLEIMAMILANVSKKWPTAILADECRSKKLRSSIT